jgi:mRNA interferase RelE/StbE
MLKIEYSRQAAKILRRLPPKHGRQLATKITALSRDPYPPDSAKLVGAPFRRADVGEYRIIYDVEGETLRIVLVGKRNDAEVYRRLKRQLR